MKSDSEEKFSSFPSKSDRPDWCYLFIHHTKVEVVQEWLQKRFNVFIHKSIRYKNDSKRVVKDERPTISGLIFVQGDCSEIQSYLSGLFFGLYLVKDCSTGDTAIIKDATMQSFMQVSQLNPTRIRFMPHTFDYYSKGNTMIRVTSGALAGLEGYRIRIARDKCFVTSIGGLTIAIGGIHKDSFENIDEYVKQRREQIRTAGKSSVSQLTPLQAEIDKGFFYPENELDNIAIVNTLSYWLTKVETMAAMKHFDDVTEIALYVLEEVGRCYFPAFDDLHLGDTKETEMICRELDGHLMKLIESTDVSTDLKEIIAAGRESLAIRFPFLPFEI